MPAEAEAGRIVQINYETLAKEQAAEAAAAAAEKKRLKQPQKKKQQQKKKKRRKQPHKRVKILKRVNSV